MAPVAGTAIAAEALDLVRRSARGLVVTHHNPDGDALGSAAGLALTLMNQGARVEVLLRGSWPDHLAFVLDGLKVRGDLSGPQDYDLVILLDCHAFDRLGDGFESLATDLAGLPLLVVDHHPLAASEVAGASWVLRPEASSTGELVWELILALGWAPPRAAGQALLLAMSSDTGFFTQSNTTPGALRAAADLLELGGDLASIHQRVRQDMPLRRLKLMGLALDSLVLHCGGRLATMIVDQEMLEATGAQLADTEDFVEFGRSLAGVELSAFFKKKGSGPGPIRVSLRSRDRVDARALALAFGGGGHRQAAAYNDPTASDIQTALANFLAQADRFL